jgi:hypothetical protein
MDEIFTHGWNMGPTDEIFTHDWNIGPMDEIFTHGLNMGPTDDDSRISEPVAKIFKKKSRLRKTKILQDIIITL